MFSALASALASGIGLVVDKIALSRHKIRLNVFLPLCFLLLFLLTVVLTPWYGQVDWDLVLHLPNVLFLVFLMIVISIAWNVLYYQSVRHEEVHQHELMTMSGPIITIVLAAVFFPEELDKRIFFLALVASLALFFAKGERHRHFQLNKTSYNTLLAVILMSTESIIIRELLHFFSPVALYALRTGVLAVFFFSYYRPRLSGVTTPQWRILLISSLMGAVTMIGRFIAFNDLGVIFTTLLAVLAPIIVFLASWEILHERIKPRVVTASIIILVCVAIATVLTVG